MEELDQRRVTSIKLQSQNTCFDQRLDFVFKDIAPASRMMSHPIKKTIVGIIRSSHFVWAFSLWQLELVVFVEQVEKCHHMLIFEGVLSLILRSPDGVTFL